MCLDVTTSGSLSLILDAIQELDHTVTTSRQRLIQCNAVQVANIVLRRSLRHYISRKT